MTIAQRILHRIMEGLVHGKDAMPQFAGKPVRIVRASGNYLLFDQEGKVHESLMPSGIEAMASRSVGKVIE